jgi:hypothetical protein
MRSLLLLLFPRRWRERYGAEVDDALQASTRPVRDGLDLLASVPSAWLGEVDARLGRRPGLRRRLEVAGAVLAVAGAVASAWAVTALRDGIVELPSHWWSTAAAVPLACGVGIVAVARRGRRPAV